MKRVIDSAASHWSKGPLEVNIDPSPNSTVISSMLWQAVKHGVAQGSVEQRLHARVTNVQTKYISIGNDRIARTVTFGAAFDVQAVPGGNLVWAGEPESTITDTVDCGSIPLLERPDDLPALHAIDPCAADAGAFSSIIEPVLLAAASATIIILLFTLRGH